MGAHAFEQFFPFPEIRSEQREAIQFVLDEFLVKKKKFVILELPTGIGKSAIAVCVSRYLNSLSREDADAPTGSYVLTTQLILQDQYVHDFGAGDDPLVVSLKSSANYMCRFYVDQTCAESKRLLNKLPKHLVGSGFQECCRRSCPYTIDKQAFIDASLGCTSFAYFLAETMYAGKLEPRDLLVIDEAHRAESQSSKFIEVVFSEKFCRDVLKCKFSKSLEQQDVFAWVRGAYKNAVSKRIKLVSAAIERSLESDNVASSFADLSKQFEVLDKHVCKVNRFISSYDEKNWVMNVVPPLKGSKRAGRRIEFKPVAVAPYCDDLLFKFGSRVLMMSATIVDKDVFCSTLGIDPDRAAFMKMRSPFPVESRKVVRLPVGSMSRSCIERTLPIMAETLKMLLEKHSDQKGIVHASTFKIAQFLFDNVKSKRLLIHDSTNREAVLKKHRESREPTVLLSPSMTEGIDLSDDASRWQCLCKVPFPYLGDSMVRRRMERDDKWYDYETVKTIVQSLGRSVRNKDDHAVSYVLDSDWDRLYARTRQMFPSDFDELLSA